MRRLSVSLLFIFVAGSVGCMNASIEQISEGLTEVLEPLLQKSQLTGFVSGTSHGNLTSGGFRIETSTGNYTNKLQTSTAGGYKVFVSVQGSIISE